MNEFNIHRSYAQFINEKLNGYDERILRIANRSPDSYKSIHAMNNDVSELERLKTDRIIFMNEHKIRCSMSVDERRRTNDSDYIDVGCEDREINIKNKHFFTAMRDASRFKRRLLVKTIYLRRKQIIFGIFVYSLYFVIMRAILLHR